MTRPRSLSRLAGGFRLPLPSKVSAISSSSDETADPIVSSLDLKKITLPPCLYLIKLDVKLGVDDPLYLRLDVDDWYLRLALGIEVCVHGRHTGKGGKDRAAGICIVPQLWVK